MTDEQQDATPQRKKFLIIAAALLAAAVLAGILLTTRSDDANPATVERSELGEEEKELLNPGGLGTDVDPSAVLKPVKGDKVDREIIPQLLRGEDDITLPQPSSPENEVQEHCTLLASILSSDRPDLLAVAYGNEEGEAIDSDDELLLEFNKQVDSILAKYPATERPLLAIECGDVSLDPQEYANGSHRMRFSLSASVIDSNGDVYAKSLWDSSNILEDRLLTLNRDGFYITDEGEEKTGLVAEFSELLPN